MPPDVAALSPGDVDAGPPNHQDMLDRIGVGDSLIGGFLQRRGLAAPELPVGGDQDFGLGVIDAGAERGGGEPGEDHAVQDAQACAGQHRHHGFGDHRQVDRDAVAGHQTQIRQGVGGFAHLGQEIAVGQGAVVADPLALPMDGDPVAVARFDVAVHAVVGDVEFAVGEPFGKRPLRPVQHLGKRCGPRQPVGLLGPESQPVLLGLVDTGLRGVGLRGELFGGGYDDGACACVSVTRTSVVR